ncbi:MAG: YabP/YqfC family sporulation protein [Clostridia bacterium]
MDSFYDEMMSKLYLDKDIYLDFRVTICAFKGLYVEGHKGIMLYNPNRIVINVTHKKNLEIIGSNMVINEIGSAEIFIKGNIKNVEVCLV